MIKNFIVIYLLLNLFDSVWFKYGPMSLMISKIQLENTKTNILNMMIFNIIVSIALIKFVLPNINKKNIYLDTLKYSLLMSLIIYGSYSLRTSIFLKKFNIYYDIIYGLISTIIIVFISKKIEILIKDII